MQPNYSLSPRKRNARALNIEQYREYTGLSSIPHDRSYLTLCNKQPDNEGSEITQVLESGLIRSKSQFIGIDIDADIIQENNMLHPEANWYHGDFLSVLEENEFNPAMIYLDTTGFCDHYPATRLVVGTMFLCPPDCMLFANVMLNNPRSSASRLNDKKLLENIGRMVPPSVLSRWQLKIPSYRYSVTGRTDMKTFILYKRS